MGITEYIRGAPRRFMICNPNQRSGTVIIITRPGLIALDNPPGFCGPSLPQVSGRVKGSGIVRGNRNVSGGERWETRDLWQCVR